MAATRSVTGTSRTESVSTGCPPWELCEPDAYNSGPISGVRSSNAIQIATCLVVSTGHATASWCHADVPSPGSLKKPESCRPTPGYHSQWLAGLQPTYLIHTHTLDAE